VLQGKKQYKPEEYVFSDGEGIEEDDLLDQEELGGNEEQNDDDSN
jgi:hypothetical protein